VQINTEPASRLLGGGRGSWRHECRGERACAGRCADAPRASFQISASSSDSAHGKVTPPLPLPPRLPLGAAFCFHKPIHASNRSPWLHTHLRFAGAATSVATRRLYSRTASELAASTHGHAVSVALRDVTQYTFSLRKKFAALRLRMSTLAALDTLTCRAADAPRRQNHDASRM
jgi:hypothetical protein